MKITMRFLIILFLVATALDLSLTYVGIEADVASEANPLLQFFIGKGLFVFLLGSSALAGLSIGLMWMSVLLMKEQLREKARKAMFILGSMMHLVASGMWIAIMLNIL